MENYIKYYRKPRVDNRGRLAKFIDYYGMLFFIAFVTTVLIVTSTQNLAAGLSIAAILVFVEARVFKMVTNKLRDKANMHRRYFLAGENCLKAILALKHGKEFNTLVKEILSRQEGFSNLHLIIGGDNEEEVDDPGIDLEGYYQGKAVAVRCSFFEDPGRETGQAYIKEFIGSLAERGCKNGIFVTTGRFNSRAYDLVQSLQGDFSLHLIDGRGLVELARRAGVDIFPSEEKIDRLIQEERDKYNSGKGLGLRVFYNDAKKAVLYFTAAALLIVVVLLEQWTFFSYVYIAFAVLNVVLGIMSMVLGRAQTTHSLNSFVPKKE